MMKRKSFGRGRKRGFRARVFKGRAKTKRSRTYFISRGGIRL